MDEDLNDPLGETGKTRPSGKSCKHCGREIVEENVLGDLWMAIDCDCEGAKAEREYIQEELQKRIDCEKWRKIRDKLESIIPKKYRKCTKPSLYLDPNDAASTNAVREFIKAGSTNGDCERPWLYIYGTYGSGKTSLACSILYHIMARFDNKKRRLKPPTYIFATPNSLIRELQSTFGKSDIRTNAVFKKYSMADVLILDNFASLSVSDYRADVLFDILNERYNDEGLTIFTTTCPPENLVEKLTTGSGNSDNAKSIESRIFEHSAMIKMPDKDFRKEIARTAVYGD